MGYIIMREGRVPGDPNGIFGVLLSLLFGFWYYYLFPTNLIISLYESFLLFGFRSLVCLLEASSYM